MLQKALTKELTVFLLCKNGGKEALQKTLDCLDRQHYRNFDLVVIDRGMEEEQLSAALKHGSHILELKGQNWKTGAVLNRACEISGPFSLFLCEGTVLQGERWLENFMKRLSGNNEPYIFILPEIPSHEKRSRREFFQRYRTLYTSCCAAGIRKKTFLYNRFDERLEYFHFHLWHKKLNQKSPAPAETQYLRLYTEFFDNPGSFYEYKKKEYAEYLRMLITAPPAGKTALLNYFVKLAGFISELFRYAFKGILNPLDLISLAPYVFIEEVLFKKDKRLI